MDKLIYILGLASGGTAIILAGAAFAVYRIKSASLEKKLNAEYGERKKRT